MNFSHITSYSNCGAFFVPSFLRAVSILTGCGSLRPCLLRDAYDGGGLVLMCILYTGRQELKPNISAEFNSLGSESEQSSLRNKNINVNGTTLLQHIIVK